MGTDELNVASPLHVRESQDMKKEVLVSLKVEKYLLCHSYGLNHHYLLNAHSISSPVRSKCF